MATTKRHQQNQRMWLLIGGILGSTIIIIGFFLYMANMANTSATASDPAVFNAISHVDSALLTQIKQSDNNVSKGILGSANYLTAAICASIQNEPANVCQTDYMQQIEKSLATLTL